MTNQEKLQYLKNLWVGKRVISISNGFQSNPNDTSISKGYVVDVIPITKSENPVPLVKFDGIEETFISFSTIIEYSDDIWSALNKLNANERWNIIQAFVFRFH